MTLIDRRRTLRLLMIGLTTALASGCFSGPAGPEAPNKPANPEPPPKAEIPKEVPKGKTAPPAKPVGQPL
jgi:hypothetical protein